MDLRPVVLSLTLLSLGALGAGAAPPLEDDPLQAKASSTSEEDDFDVEPGDEPVEPTDEELEYRDRALEFVAEHTAISPEELTVVNTTRPFYPTLGQENWAFDVEVPYGGEIFSVELDENGDLVDPVLLNEMEAEVYAATYGRLDRELAELLSNASEDEPLDVAIALAEPPSELLDLPGDERDGFWQIALAAGTASPPTPEEIDQLYAEIDERRRSNVAPRVEDFLQRLWEMGADPAGSEQSPVLFASLYPEQILEAATWEGVDRIHLAPEVVPSSLQTARQTVRGQIVQGRGFLGSGLVIGQVESGDLSGRVYPDFSLFNLSQHEPYVCDYSNHSTMVAGIIHGSIAGIAPDATLIAGGSCLGRIWETQQVSDALINAGVRVLNLSFGLEANLVVGGPFDRTYDGYVYNNRRTVVAAAGNKGINGLFGPFLPPAGNIQSPGIAYNVITVGNFDDKGSSSWDDDVIAVDSSAGDPASRNGDRQKPEIAAPGTNIRVPFYNRSALTGSGTSFAAPLVTGAAALSMQRDSTLAVWPEAIKAILMASAINNVEGAVRLSDADGAGGLAINRADNVVAWASGGYGKRTYSCSEGQFSDVARMWLAAGEWTRVAIAWSTPVYRDYINVPAIDLDLQVIDRWGNVVSRSTSRDNTYEIVRFQPDSSGDYTLRVRRKNGSTCAQPSTYLGWAWHRN